MIMYDGFAVCFLEAKGAQMRGGVPLVPCGGEFVSKKL